MKPGLRVTLAAAVPAALVFTLNFFLTSEIRGRLQDVDPEASFAKLAWGTGAVFLESVTMPGIGLNAESVWVTVGGSIIHPYPEAVVIKGGTLDPFSGGSNGNSDEVHGDILPVSLQNTVLPDGSQLFASRLSGRDVISCEGSWGSIVLTRQEERFTAVFTDLAGLPMQTSGIPPILRGHTVSGICSGTHGNFTEFSGFITGFDHRPAAATFDYRLVNGVPTASFSLDFFQVSEPFIAILDSLSAGAIMTAVPSGSLHVNVRGSDSVFFAASLNFDSISVYSPSVAPDTFSTSAFLQCTGFILPEDCLLSVDSGLLRVEEAETSFDLNCSWGDRRRLVLNAYNNSLSGEAITASVPPQLLGRLRGLSLSGEINYFMTLVLDWDTPDSCDVQFDIDASGLYVAWSPVSFSALRDSAGGASCTMTDSWGNSRVIALDGIHNDNFVVYDSIPYFFEPLLCCAEDASFRRHQGFSEFHIRNSIRADMEEGRFIRGGSTITMQLAKNLFLGREKTLARKLQEVFLTWRIEHWLSKNRIIELYANIVELGPGVFGFNSAGMYYFNKPFSALSVRETAFLVSILPGPRLYHRFGTGGTVPAYWNSYLDRLISICGSRGWLDEQLVARALSETLIFNGQVSGSAVDGRGSQSN